MKVNLSNDQNKKSYFPISVDSSTTMNFGEVLPNFCHEVVPQTHCKIDVSSGVRFAPLSLPTFGKCYLKNYTFVHKLSDLYPPFNDLLAKTPFTGSSGLTYTPSQVPSIPAWLLWLSVLSNCEFSFYRCDLTKVRKAGLSDTNQPFVYSDIPYFPVSNVRPAYTSSENLSNKELSYSLIRMLTYFLSQGSPHLLNFNGFGSTAVLYDNYVGTFSESSTAWPFYDLLTMDNYGLNCGSVYRPCYDSISGSTGVLSDSRITLDSADFVVGLSSGNSTPSAVIPGLGYYTQPSTGPLNPVDPDFGSGLYFNTLSATGSSGNDVIIAIRLTDSGKFLRKIFMGLGYQIAPVNRQVSLLPLFAYFRSYFETFAPKRFIKFGQSYFARFINEIVLSGRSATQIITSGYNPINNVIGVPTVRWNNIIDDLLSCYYTKDTDYYSAQIIGMINDYGGYLVQEYIGVKNDFTPAVAGIASNPETNAAPSLDFVADEIQHTQAQQNILSRLTQFVNRRSVVGGKIASLLKSVFGISQKEVDDYNAFVGSGQLDVYISDVFSMAETQEGSLGEYAGKASTSGNLGSFSLDVDTHSLIINLSTLIPRTQYVQGFNPSLDHINGSDFYNPMFDGLTLLPTRKTTLYSPQWLIPYDEIGSKSSFGNIPVYSEYKTKSSGILNGDLSLRSTRNSYDSFTMDEIISDFSIDEPSSSKDGTGVYKVIQYDPSGLVAGTMWRYLGRWLWLGRFDRIFLNNRINYQGFMSELTDNEDAPFRTTRNIGRTDDNLIVHNIIDIVMNSPMIPLAGSWMTDDLLSLDRDGLKVQSE